MASLKLFPPFIGFMLAVAMVFLSVFVWVVESHHEAEQSRLATNIGEIKRIDEVLTSSALLAAATGEAAYEARYNAHVGELERILSETLEQFSTDEARAMLRQTEAANKVLVDLETRALAELDGTPNPAAFALLNSAEYLENKQIYANGTDRAFAEMRIVNAETIERIHYLLLGLAAAVAVLSPRSVQSAVAAGVGMSHTAATSPPAPVAAVVAAQQEPWAVWRGWGAVRRTIR